MKQLLLVLGTCCFLVFQSCNSKAPKIKLNRTERNLVDSLYKESIPEIDSILDANCKNFRKEKYQQIKDSIISIRLSEIEQILPN